MLGEVTQDNLHLFIPGKVAGVAVLMAEERGISPEEALVEFYRTRTYRLLETRSRNIGIIRLNSFIKQ